MAELTTDQRKAFWSRPGTFAIVGGFEAPEKLSWRLLEQCQKDGISAVPVHPELDEVLGVKVVADPAQVPSLAGIVCVRLDPHATEAAEQAAELGVPVWFSMRTASESVKAVAERTGIDIVSNVCPLMYLDSHSYHAFHRGVAKVFRAY